jgi:hypothetical protein
MNKQNLMVKVAAVTALALVAGIGSAQKPTNPRYGHWKLKSEAPAPQSNVMSYDPLPDGGMKVTIDQMGKDGTKSSWGYDTHFDGKQEPLHGNQGVDTGSVRAISDKVNEIVYMKDGKVVQVLENTLSPDNSTLGIVYFRMKDGKTTNVTFATYEKQP